jgi:hypothetical protein
MITEDFYSGHFSVDAFDDNEEVVTDEVKMLEISNLIEDQRL